MADIETLDQSEHTSSSEAVNGVQDQSSSQGMLTNGADVHLPLSDFGVHTSGPPPASPSPSVGPVPLREPTPNGSTPATSTTLPLVVPHPKKFSHSTINKKFLEKASSGSTSGPALSATTTNKAGTLNQKPVVQPAVSHSRLVTAKLTAGPQPSTLTGPGWSRPSSTGSAVTPTPSSATNKLSPSLTPPTVQASAAQTPASKIIHPQPRPVVEGMVTSKKEPGSKPAWGNTKSGATINSDSVQSDFPTAAEVAQAKLNEKKQAAQAAAQKQALAAEADTFRGVHLGSGHHWDDDEGDGDDFLGGVIEFGDGRQYTIPTEPHPSSPPRDLPDLATDIEGESSTKQSETPSSLGQPVSKEERFADDFDRSWPRSRNPTLPPSKDQPFSHGLSPSASSQPPHSPQEGSRVLFNERSNRLEPYSNQSHRFSTGGRERELYPPRRDARPDYTTSPEMRGGRDLPPHTGRSVQLLLKGDESVSDSTHRSRGFNDRSLSVFPHDKSRGRDPPRREYGHPPHMLKSTHPANEPRPGDRYDGFGSPSVPPAVPRNDERTRRTSTGHEPPPLSPALDATRTDARPVTPRLPALQVAPPHRSPPSGTESAATSAVPSALSPTSLVSASPMTAESPLQPGAMPFVDLDEVRKLAMHSAAERAKLRRQQEEEEREKKKERARRKAAELEAKMKAETKVGDEASVEAVAETEAIEIIESAVKSVSQVSFSKPPGDAQEVPPTSGTPPVKSPFSRVPSTRGGVRPAPRRPPPSPSITSEGIVPVKETDSWRRPNVPQQQKPPLVPSIPPPPTVFHEVESLSIKADEDVEVVDFSELNKLVGKEVHLEPEEDLPDTPTSTQLAARPSRPVAADFFEDTARSRTTSTFSGDGASWRRKSVIADDAQTINRVEHLALRSPEQHSQQIPHSPIHAHAQVPLHRRMSVTSDDHLKTYGHPRSPLAASYREAPMSALDDTIARIRGAMTGLQQKTDVASPKQAPKWLPPALRARPASLPDEPPNEVFDTTAVEPPRSPMPVSANLPVRLPSISRPAESLSKKQVHLSRTVPHVRTDIFSWDPPIEGMNRKEFHLNDILFRRPLVIKGGHIKYTVSLPRPQTIGTDRLNWPIVNLPLRPPVGSNHIGAFGKKKEADEASSWRRPTTSTKLDVPGAGETLQGLDTTSRSPPPDTSAGTPPAPLGKADDVPSSPVGTASARPRTQPKMPDGSDVAFYRKSRSSAASLPNATVNFTVNSELEELSNLKLSITVPPDITGLDKRDQIGSPDTNSTPPSTNQKPEVRKPEVSPELAPISPLSMGSTPWSKSPRVFSLKDSPARPPDPEHLKAVWETTSNKAEPASINSLERIEDDMTAVPFTMMDMKSDDGGTPPPFNSNPPSRMSQHDVARAFQQVPASSTTSTSSHRPVSASATGTVSTLTSPSRKPQHHMPPPTQHPNTTVRPMYPGYPSPLMSSPSPTMVYPMSMTPSPIPRPMVVSGTPQYPQAMWVPVPGPPGPTHNGMIRGPHPYGAQLMPYPPPPGVYPPLPPHTMQGNVSQPPTGIQNRAPNGMSMMSPVVPQAHAHNPHPVYGHSPIMMHASAAPAPVGPGFPNANQPSRGQMRPAYDQVPGMMPYAPPGPHLQHAPSYTPIPSNAFDRPW